MKTLEQIKKLLEITSKEEEGLGGYDELLSPVVESLHQMVQYHDDISSVIEDTDEMVREWYFNENSELRMVYNV